MATATTENSQRANSRKNRVYTFHHFLCQTYPTVQTVLDVAGGRGDLSFLLRNVNGANSIIADPRVPSFTRIIKSIHFLVRNPNEARIRSVEGLNTHQPLAKLVSSWMERQTCMDVDTASYRANIIQLTIPKNMRIHVDNHLVNAIQDVVTIDNGKELVLHDDLTSWDAYWESEAIRIASNTSYYGGTAPKGNHNVGYESNAVNDSRDAIEELKMLDLIVGFHPDQATEEAINLAIYLRIPFAIVPCCVFPSEFPNRTHNGKVIKSYNEFLIYLSSKHSNIRRSELPFVGSDDTAKNVVLYMLKEDFS